VRSLVLLALLVGSACAAQPGAPPAEPALASGAPHGIVGPAVAPTADAAIPPAADTIASVRAQADAWRAAHRLIDLHTHVDATPERMGEAVRVLDAVGVGVAINLSGGTVTHSPGQPSAFEQTKRLADERFPGRFLEYMNLDYADWDSPDFAKRAVAQVEEGARLGAAGFKEFKRLGLFLRDAKGRLIKVDDAKLDPMWHRLGELGMPVSIHVADPKAFWGSYDASNERWTELKDHPRWWFGDASKYPPREELLAALERVVSRHPETTFVCVHFANNAEDLDWVGAQLDAHPNMMADIAARVPEIGRHDPDRVRAVFVKHADRILFATDFQVYEHMTLGSGGSGPPPTEADALEFYRKHWRFFETADRDFPHMTPIQGDWTISAIHLPADVLAKIYFENAERLLAKPLARLAHPHP
jgi:predicted TIM-barrel fold metal-dependent hydrolase